MADRPQLMTTEGRADNRLMTGLRSLRVVVACSLLLDILTTLIAQTYGLEGGPRGPLANVQLGLVLAGSIAVLWRRYRVAVPICLLCGVEASVATATGSEIWLLLIVSVVAAATARPRSLAAVVLALAAYAVAFGYGAERAHAGWGTPAAATVALIAATGLGIGIIGRLFLRSRNRRADLVAAYERENRKIRTDERARLADELEVLVTEGIKTVLDLIDRTPRSATAEQWRQLLTEIDRRSRNLLAELRALLELLRREPVETRPPTSDGPAPIRQRSSAVIHRGVAAVAVLILAITRALLVQPGQVDADLIVQACGLGAFALAIWRPVLGAGAGFVTLGLALVIRPDQPWDCLGVGLLCLIGTARFGLRRGYLVLGPLVAYVLLRYAVGMPDPVLINYLAYVALIGILVGLAVRHFREARSAANRRLDALTTERDRIETDERSAVARELHDVVAHQLSLSSLHIMATSLSEDAATLAATAAKVQQSSNAARDELTVLMHAMRTHADRGQPAPLITPTACAAALAARLADNDFQLDVTVDVQADSLDATTQRTLSRAMQESATNILRYTARPARCQCVLTVTAAHVELTISSPLAGSDTARTSNLSLGWGLRGLRERVDLTHGRFEAGPQGDQWVVQLSLPTDDSDESPATIGADPAVRV